MAGDHERDADGDGLLLIHGEEVDVQAGVRDGMPLQFVQDGGLRGAAVQDEVHDVGLRRVGEGLEFFGVDGEEDVLESEAVQVARHEAFAAEGLDDGLVADLAGLAFQFKMLHCSVC